MTVSITIFMRLYGPAIFSNGSGDDIRICMMTAPPRFQQPGIKIISLSEKDHTDDSAEMLTQGDSSVTQSHSSYLSQIDSIGLGRNRRNVENT